jgi:hypothetical protein
VTVATALMDGSWFFTAVSLLELADAAQGLRCGEAELETETCGDLHRQVGRLVGVSVLS